MENSKTSPLTSFEDIKELLIGKFGPEVIVKEEIAGLQPILVILPEKIAEVCLELRNNDRTYFDYLECLSGIDYGTDENMFAVAYHLCSIPYKLRLSLKVVRYHDRSREDLPSFPSVSSVWRTAEWHEREAFDLLGISFEGNADLRRVLLPDDWEGYPLRKDYKAQEYYHGIKV